MDRPDRVVLAVTEGEDCITDRAQVCIPVVAKSKAERFESIERQEAVGPKRAGCFRWIGRDAVTGVVTLDTDEVGGSTTQLPNRLSVVDVDIVHAIDLADQPIPDPLVQEVRGEACGEAREPAWLPLLERGEVIPCPINRFDERVHEPVAQVAEHLFAIGVAR